MFRHALSRRLHCAHHRGSQLQLREMALLSHIAHPCDHHGGAGPLSARCVERGERHLLDFLKGHFRHQLSSWVVAAANHLLHVGGDYISELRAHRGVVEA